MSSAFVDTNVLLRHLLQDHDDYSHRASRIVDEISNGEVSAHISETVVFETIFTLTKTYGVPRELSSQLVRDLLGLDLLIVPNKASLSMTLRLWEDESSLSFADCYHLVLTKSLGLTEIYSFDKKMGRYPGVTRIEP